MCNHKPTKLFYYKHHNELKYDFLQWAIKKKPHTQLTYL